MLALWSDTRARLVGIAPLSTPLATSSVIVVGFGINLEAGGVGGLVRYC